MMLVFTSTAIPDLSLLEIYDQDFYSLVRTSQETLGLHNKAQPVNAVYGNLFSLF
jgi:hypothetical protein